MIDNIQLLQMTSNLAMGGTNSCNCENSNSGAFDMVMISLLKAVSQNNKDNNVITNNTQNNKISLETQNSIQNTNKIQSSYKDDNINKMIDDAIRISSEKYGVDENLIRAIIKVESNFNPNTVSSAGAKGLMQLMPFNCEDLGVTNPFDIYQNIDGGTRHIKEYIDKYDGDIQMGLMAYNGGPTRMAKRGVKSVNDIYKMPKETQNYVPKVMKYYIGEMV